MSAESTSSIATSSDSLASKWQLLRSERPSVRARDAAAELGVTEAELVASTVGHTAVQLDVKAKELLEGIATLGPVMGLTRNDHAVIEVTGVYGGVDLEGHAGTVINDQIDLRVFSQHWRHAFAITENVAKGDGVRRSIQVFDAHGTAVHKVYLKEGADIAAWDALIANYALKHETAMTLEPPPVPKPERADSEVDVEAFRCDYDPMTDTHDFYFLLGKHAVSRIQSMRIAGEPRVTRVPADSLRKVLDGAAETKLPIMIFVGNRGCIEIYSGKVERIVQAGPWLNVLDPGHNLHVREDHIATAWIVRKPTRAGVVTSLEIYDQAGENIALLYRKRADRDKAEDPDWQALLDRAGVAE